MNQPRQDYQGRSRFHLRRKAVRPQLPARLLLMGASGSGKTWSSLSIASVLAGTDGSVVMIDTEQQQGEHTASVTYADVFPNFDLVPWDGTTGFDIRDFTATLRDSASSMGADDVLIIDGITPIWKWCLAEADKFSGWSRVRPLLNQFIEAVKTHPSHVILCVRAKTQWNVDEAEDSRGRTRQRITMNGVGPDFSSDIVYEANVAVLIDQDHAMTVIKSRTSALADRTYGPEQETMFAEQLAEWLAGGQELADTDATKALASSFDVIADAELRSTIKRDFVAGFGRPQDILAKDLADAQAWVAEHVMPHATPDDAAALTEPQEAVVGAGEHDAPADDVEPEMEFSG